MNIIQTRLFKPPVKDGYLIRSGLLNKLIKNQYKPVTLVVAPAGYGKSVAVSHRNENFQRKYIWLLLDSILDNRTDFVNYLYNL